MRRPALAIALLFCAACAGDDNVIAIDTIVRFVPTSLDFGDVAAGESKELPVRLESTGGDSMQIQDVRFEPSNNAFIPIKTAGGSFRGSYLSPGAPIELSIAYQPQVAERTDATMFVVFEGGEAKLPLKGSSFPVLPAHPQLSPSEILFQPAIELGRRVTQSITVRNIGEKPGSIEALTVSPPFSITEVGGGPLSNVDLMPDQSRTIEVGFRPTMEQMYSATLVIGLDGGDTTTLAVRGEGVRPGMLSCVQTMLDFGEVERGGTADRAVDCTVSDGTFTVQSISTDNSAFAVISGAPAYDTPITELHLQVRFSAAGVSAPTAGKLTILSGHNTATNVELAGRVAPPMPAGTDLKVRMAWNTADTDYDLHLVREGGLPFQAANDCYFEETHPDWGQSGDSDDDPFLDRDDQLGFGPEEINLGRATGRYDVYIQYFGSTSATPPSSLITVDFWLRGVQSTQMRMMGVCGNMWHMGRLDFTGATPFFSPIGTEVDTYRGRALNCP
jgi:hypothetical protein